MNPLAPLIDWNLWREFVLRGPGALLGADELRELERDRARLVVVLEEWKREKR